MEPPATYDDSSTETGPTDITITIPPFKVDEESSYPSPLHHIYIRSLLSDEEVDTALKIAVEHAEANNRFLSPDTDRHVSYSTCDFPVDECERLETFFESVNFQDRLFEQFSSLYNVDGDDLTFDDLFVAYYQAKPDGDDGVDDDETMDRLELHRDGGLLSFSLLLNHPDEFEGGGTFYDALRDVTPSGILHSGGAIRPRRAGDAVLHCGKILHGADVVTSGKRVVLVGFVDVTPRYFRKGVLGNACKDWGRQDVAKYRFEAQQKRKHKGWMLNNSRWISKDLNNSALRGFVPASSGVVRRADPEFSRLRRLEAEDTLLQDILLLPEERAPKEEVNEPIEIDSIADGSITVLD